MLIFTVISAFCAHKSFIHYMDHLDFVAKVEPRSTTAYQSHTNCTILFLCAFVGAISAILTMFSSMFVAICCVSLCLYILWLPVNHQIAHFAEVPAMETYEYNNLSENPEHWHLDTVWNKSN